MYIYAYMAACEMNMEYGMEWNKCMNINSVDFVCCIYGRNHKPWDRFGFIFAHGGWGVVVLCAVLCSHHS